MAIDVFYRVMLLLLQQHGNTSNGRGWEGEYKIRVPVIVVAAAACRCLWQVLQGSKLSYLGVGMSRTTGRVGPS